MQVDRKPKYGLNVKDQRRADREAAFRVRTSEEIDTMSLDELLTPLSAMVHSIRSCYINGTNETKGFGRIRAGMSTTHHNRKRAE